MDEQDYCGSKPKSAKIRDQLFSASGFLGEHGIIRPRRHAELLLESILNVDRTALYLATDKELSQSEVKQFELLLKRRSEGEPVQYLVGWAPFWGREFKVTRGIFIPRFDTELIIDLFLEDFRTQIPSKNELNVLDICCGSGVLGLTIAAEASSAKVILADVSQTALDYTKKNAESLGVQDRVNVVEWSALTDPPASWWNRFDVVICNPPYIPVEQIPTLNPDVQNEPHIALSDGGDGLSFYLKLKETLPIILSRGGWFAFEIGDDMGASVSEIFKDSAMNGAIYKDLSNNPRVFKGIYTP